MFTLDLLPIIIIGVTVACSLIAFNDFKLFNRYMFNTDAILHKKQWDRMLTSGLLHGDHMHLIFNMVTLYFFSDVIISWLSPTLYFLIYVVSIFTGNLLSLWMYRKNPNYNAVGASGGVTGIIFAAIALNPHLTIGVFFFLPMEGWIFGILYLFYSVYAMKKKLDNIGHAAHLGGAITGILTVIAVAPQTLVINGLYIGLLFIPIIVLGYFVYKER